MARVRSLRWPLCSHHVPGFYSFVFWFSGHEVGIKTGKINKNVRKEKNSKKLPIGHENFMLPSRFRATGLCK